MASLGVKENFRLASNDFDYHGQYEKLFDEPLCYDEALPLTGLIGDELNKITDDAAQRVTEAKLSFGPIASILDYHCSQAAGLHMPVKQASALKNFSDEIILVTKRHFEAYVRCVPAQICNDGITGKSAALKEKVSSISLLSNINIENVTPWTTHRIQNAPRNYGTLNRDFEHQLIPITALT
ncbi:hypothetical protein EPUL_000118 [Erysiphe pulchra]|uniref:Uncharacterized protein n=1 Tax=Erysiphe pulchra TaxID=225359 RepID=A0A2S4Q288_9PEZI|nr:hypothetical protein EPUL_000118 [Erysiphe pulchra]